MAAARYLYRQGLVVADDVIRTAAKAGTLPLDGALIVRLQKPVPCLFISYGLGGVSLPDTGVCAVGDACNPVSKEEQLAAAHLMYALDPEFALGLRIQWYLVDLKETEGVVIKNPTDQEIAKIYKSSAQLKRADNRAYQVVARIARKRTTAGAQQPDGHEGDSDKDPLQTFFDDMQAKEERSEKARQKRLQGVPDIPGGRLVVKFLKGAEEAATAKRAEKQEGEEEDQEEEEDTLTLGKTRRRRKRVREESEPAVSAAPATLPCTAGAKSGCAALPSHRRTAAEREVLAFSRAGKRRIGSRGRGQQTARQIPSPAKPPPAPASCAPKGPATAPKVPQRCSSGEEEDGGVLSEAEKEEEAENSAGGEEEDYPSS